MFVTKTFSSTPIWIFSFENTARGAGFEAGSDGLKAVVGAVKVLDVVGSADLTP